MYAKGSQSDFAVIAGAQRFFDAGLAIGEQAGEQQARLHLRAGYGHLVVDGFQSSAGNAQRRLAFLRCDLRAHLRERLDDALHGAAGERFVADHLTGEFLSGNDTAQHAHG